MSSFIDRLVDVVTCARPGDARTARRQATEQPVDHERNPRLPRYPRVRRAAYLSALGPRSCTARRARSAAAPEIPPSHRSRTGGTSLATLPPVAVEKCPQQQRRSEEHTSE